ncbi:hypothetical protein HPP92_004534 [Vanilla planifolia]|uniref:Beta-glucosidase n=1 Tax=Vanilla planifolia TaxID=51239 RepID=A0A835RZL7_VANPL|nr:hypothetical protein HPP92_004534 [Vanilla planifolia]
MALVVPVGCYIPTGKPLTARTRLCAPAVGRSASRRVVARVQEIAQLETKVDDGVLTRKEDSTAPRFRRKNFPPDFVFGAATAAYQVEGAANLGGKEPSVWDTFTHKFPEKIADGSNGDVAADSYHRYKEDVQLLVDLGMDAYRFSISWSRILPKGRGKVNPEGVQYYNNLINELLDKGIKPYATLFHWDLPQALEDEYGGRGKVNPEGVQYYNNLINELLDKGIKPYATLFHWDLPQALEDEYGGFLSDKLVEDYKNYTEVCFKEFGDRVKHWITFNEPYIFTTLGYGFGIHAPGRCTPGLDLGGGTVLNCPVGDSLREPYIVGHNLLKAHAEAVQLYREKYQAEQNGQIGITLVSHWMVPIDDTPQSKDAQERSLQFNLGWFFDPIKFGDYPLSMRALVRERLPHFTPEETEKLKDSFDFVGLNYYTARYAREQPITKDFKPHSFLDDPRVDVQPVDNEGVPIDHAEPGSWINVHPRGVREILLYIKHRYDNPPIYITENGVLEKDNKEISLRSALDDTHRSEYLALHLHELKEAVRHGVDLKGYFTWSLIDNFEWHDGYSSRLGLHYIDYYGTHKLEHEKPHGKLEGRSPPHLRRIPKQSVLWFKRFLERV